MKRLLFTGASGFIGRHCLPALHSSGYEVHAVSRRLPLTTSGDEDIRWHQADLLDPEQVKALVAEIQPTHLLHLAWYAVPGRFWTSPENLRWVQGSLDLFQSFAAAGGRRIVVAGTCAEYSWSPAGICQEKTTPLAPGTLYGACKHALHLILQAFAGQTDLSYAWGRIFFPYGPHDHPEKVVSYVVRSMLRGEPVRCTHGRQIRDFLYVADVATAIVALLNAETSGPINIGSGKSVSVKKMILTAGEITGRQDLIRFGALASREGEPEVLVADVARLRDTIGWTPDYDLAGGIRETVNWWQQQLSASAAQDTRRS
jgi:nucleoside-diphosphate-sugar epimerase